MTPKCEPLRYFGAEKERWYFVTRMHLKAQFHYCVILDGSTQSEWALGFTSKK